MFITLCAKFHNVYYAVSHEAGKKDSHDDFYSSLMTKKVPINININININFFISFIYTLSLLWEYQYKYDIVHITLSVET